MEQNIRLRSLVLMTAALFPVADAAALTLGRARGAVLVGRPLDLAIPVTMEAADKDEPCVDGEVFYGERRVDQRLNVRWEAGPERQGVLRVGIPALVDEPMVTLYLRVGCTQRMTRRYVLLSELPPEQEPATPLVNAPRATPALRTPQDAPAVQARPPQSAPRAGGTAAPGAAAAGARSEGAPPAPSAAPVAPARAAAAAPGGPSARERRAAARRAAAAQQAARAPAPPAPGRARLRLEPIELMAERDPTLRLSTELQVAPNADPKARTWATALWQALSKPPEEAAQESQRLQAIETEMQSLRALTQQNASALNAMAGQLEKARGERNQITVVAAALLALLLVAAAGLWWFWRRGRQEARNRWYAGEETGLSDLAKVAAAGPEVAAGTLEPTLSASAPAHARPARPLRPDEVRAAPLAATAKAGDTFPTAARPADSEHSDFVTSQGGSIRMVRVDELIDIQDKANFFLSIGQHDQAVAVLEGHVHDQVETSALAWLDLLDLYHSLGRRAEFARLRGEFRQHFNAQVPEFDEFDIPSGGLEDYGRALSRIVALWPSPRVLDVIEESIFRKPGVGGADAFSLEAYRELILLYNVAREVIPVEDDGPVSLREETPTGFTHTTLESLSALESNTSAGADKRYMPPASPRLGLDIDLDVPTTPVPPSRAASPAPVQDPGTIELEPLDFDTSWNDLDGDTLPPKP